MKAKVIPDVKFIEEMIASFTVKSCDFSLRKQLLLFLGMISLVTDITEFSCEAKETWKWLNKAKIQTEIIIVVEDAQVCSTSRPFPQ